MKLQLRNLKYSFSFLSPLSIVLLKKSYLLYLFSKYYNYAVLCICLVKYYNYAVPTFSHCEFIFKLLFTFIISLFFTDFFYRTLPYCTVPYCTVPYCK